MIEILNIDSSKELVAFTIRASRDEVFNVFLEFDANVSDEWKKYFSEIYQSQECEDGDSTIHIYSPVGSAVRPASELNANARIVVQTLTNGNGNVLDYVPPRYTRLMSAGGQDVFITDWTRIFRVYPEPNSNVSTCSDYFPFNLTDQSFDGDPLPEDFSLKIEPKCWKLMNSKAWQLGRLRIKTRRVARYTQFVLTYDLSKLETLINDNMAFREISDQFQTVANRFAAQASEQIAAYYIDLSNVPENFEFSFPYKSYDRINFNFSADTTVLLQGLVARGERLLVPVTAMYVEGNMESEREEFVVEIMPQTATDGILAIDCGTSSCIAYLYDPNQTVETTFNAPEEQVAFLSEKMKKWVIGECNDMSKPEKTVEWRRTVVEVLHALQTNFKDDQNIEEYLNNSRCFDPYETNCGLFKFLFQLEKVLRNRSELSLADSVKKEFYVDFVNRFYEIYRQSFEQYSFSEYKLKGIPLGDAGQLETSSEFKYKGEDPEDKTPCGEVGERIAAERKREQASYEYWIDKKRIYERNPKELINSLYRVDSEDHKRYYAFLKSVVDKAMKGYCNRNGRFLPQIIATYPATLLSESRRELKEMFLQMGFPQVDLSYDESVAPAIFYLDKMCGTFDDYGPEGFKSSCTRIGDAWYHNMLVVDVGAGTTDVSALQVKMTETYPIDVGAPEYVRGGRNYEITPYLLGASGNPQIAGNLLTLKIFYRLKALLVAYKLSRGVQEATVADMPNQATLNGNERDFINNINKSERIDLTAKEREEVRTALSVIERHLPTEYLYENPGDGDVQPVEQTEEFGERYNLFNVLWEIAEKLKVKFSEQIAKNIKGDFSLLDSSLPLREHWDEIFDNVPIPQTEEDALSFKYGDFDTLAKNVVTRISEIAVNLIREALRVREKNNPDLKEACLGVDSIILSGCSSKLPQMKREFENAIKESISQVGQRFATPRTKILFEDQYAKSSTAVGALRGANVKSVAAVNVNGDMQIVQGFCSRRIDVENLSFFLPADFKSGANVFFEMQTQFEPVGLLNERSIVSKYWNAMPVGEIHIDKAIGKFISHANYAELSNSEIQGEIRAALQQDFARFNPTLVRYRLEINSDQEIFALLARTDANNQLQLAYTTSIPGLDRPFFDNVYQPLTREIDSQTARQLFQVNNGQITLTERLRVCNGGHGQDLTFSHERTDNGQYEALIDAPCYLDEDYRNGNAYCAWFERNASELAIDFERQTPTIQTGDGEVLACFNLASFYAELALEERSFDVKSTKFNVMLCVKLTPEGDIDKAQFNLFVGKKPQYALAKSYRQWFEHDGLVYRRRINKDIQPKQSPLNPFTGLH